MFSFLLSNAYLKWHFVLVPFNCGDFSRTKVFEGKCSPGRFDIEIGVFDVDEEIKCEQGCRERGSVHGDGCCQSQIDSQEIRCNYFVNGKREEGGDEKSKAVECKKRNTIFVEIKSTSFL